MTVRDNIDAAIEAALLTVPGPARVDIDPPGEPDTFPDLAVFKGPDREIEREAHLSRREGLYTVEGSIENATSTARAELTALHAAAVAALMADQTLGGVVEMIDPGDCRWAPRRLVDLPILTFAQDFTIQFVTVRDNPALPA